MLTRRRTICWLALSVVILYFLIPQVLIERLFRREFDSNLWIAADEVGRGRMVYDLQAKQILISNTREEVIQLLGQEKESGSPKSLTYPVDIGFRILFSKWLYFLVIDFDSAGRVETVTVMD